MDKNTLQIMIDRRLSGDDGKGLGRGDASYSPPSLIKLDLLLENKNDVSRPDDSFPAFYSSVAYFTLQNLLYPPELLLLDEKKKELENWRSFKWSCNIELINIRYLDEQTGLILLRRLPFDQTLPQLKCLEDDFVSALDFIKSLKIFTFLFQKNLYNGLSVFSKTKPLILTSLTGTIDQPIIVDEQILGNLLKAPLKIVALKFFID